MEEKRKKAEENMNDLPNNSNSTSKSPCDVMRLSRDEKPVHYTLRIQSFSLLVDALAKSETDRYESPCFDAGGYKWKLALYPKGDVKRNGSDDHISLYLVSAEDKVLSSNSVVNAMFTFLVYDNLNDTYLTIQDGKTRRFHAMKAEWGFEKLISLASFNDASNGFLVDDCCALGVDIFVKKGDEWRGDVLSFVKQPTNNKYTWTINNFALLPHTTKFSDSFIMEGCRWKLRFDYPTIENNFVSLFLVFDGVEDFPQIQKVYAEYEFAVFGQFDEVASVTKTCNSWFELGGTESACGTRTLMSSRDLLNLTQRICWLLTLILSCNRKEVTMSDDLIIEVKINAISTMKEFL